MRFSYLFSLLLSFGITTSCLAISGPSSHTHVQEQSSINAQEELGFFERLVIKRAQKRLQKQKAQTSQTSATKDVDTSGNRSWLMAVLLSLFLGVVGIDRFYLGYPLAGILKLITVGGFGIWALFDFFAILFGALKPKRGEYF